MINLDILSLRKLIKAKFEYQEPFAAAMGMAKAQLSRYMTEKQKPTFPTVAKMAEALEVPVESIIVEAKIGLHLNEAVNQKHEVLLNILAGANAVFEKEFAKYLEAEELLENAKDDEGGISQDTKAQRDEFIATMTKLSELVGDHILPTAEMLLEGKSEGDGDSDVPDLQASGKPDLFNGKLQSREETV